MAIPKSIPMKMLLLASLAPLLMGNEGCEQQTSKTSSERRLRHQVELYKLQAPRISFPGAENFDFEFVLNAQIYDVINADDRFVVAFNSGDPLTSSAVSQADRVVLMPPVGYSASSLHAMAAADANDPSQCMARVPPMMIGGQVRSFEVVSGGGLWFGFTPQGRGNGSLSGSTSIHVQNAQMEIGLVAFDPLTRSVLGTGVATPKHTKVDIDLAIDFGSFSLGPRYFYQSRLAGVTMKGLRESLRLLGDNLEAKAVNERRPVWETRVIRDYDSHVTVKAGQRHGLVVGDEFAVYNLDHYWEDDTQPCRSRYLGSVRNTDRPIAILRVASERDLGPEFSRLEVVKGTEDGTRRLPGAQVVIHKLFKPEPVAPEATPAAKDRQSTASDDWSAMYRN